MYLILIAGELPQSPIYKAVDDATRVVEPWLKWNNVDRSPSMAMADLTERIARLLLEERGYDMGIVDDIVDRYDPGSSPGAEIRDDLAELERTRRKS